MKNKIGRRNFLKSLVASPVILNGLRSEKAKAAQSIDETNFLGFLYDSTLCIGCRSCVGNCIKVNNMPNVEYGEARDIGSKSRTSIRIISDKDSKKMVYNKAQCMHCLHPVCVSSCPVSAMLKDPQTGIVYNDPAKCIGCRYCMIACPYNVVKFEWHKTLPKIIKCDLCRDTNLKEKGVPGCVEVCPSGALIFGKRNELIKIAKDRMKEAKIRADKLTQDINQAKSQLANLPISRGKTSAKRRIEKLEKILEHSKPYIPKIYGEKDGGGTSILYLANVDYYSLGFPKGLSDISPAKTAESLQGMYTGLIAPFAAYGILSFVVYHNYMQGQKNEKEGQK